MSEGQEAPVLFFHLVHASKQQKATAEENRYFKTIKFLAVYLIKIPFSHSTSYFNMN